jgi:hypothetical protein
MTSLVLISSSEKTAIKQALEAARANKTTETVLIPAGYTATITFEESRQTLYLHLAISSARESVPNPQAVVIIARQFGISSFQDAMTWREEFTPGRFSAHIAVFVEPPR